MRDCWSLMRDIDGGGLVNMLWQAEAEDVGVGESRLEGLLTMMERSTHEFKIDVLSRYHVFSRSSN
ncbi:hypothetical protein M422DRAFT_34445 [Sphaerobolus stellatus SS14]|uniref:Uncharacterized protein n=1 Tax=Sphaerobolus stellatus (strain SS14) TaxID=990650 RepID=A0A0C9VF90_SPHS4|nr:hypothetical protein M422DRAFT_34445 [Sphaerobolus stellatus SS14]